MKLSTEDRSFRWKRFFYYWRFPLLFFILFFLLLWLSDKLEGDAGGAIGAIWLFIDIPCLIFFTVRAIYFRIRSIITYLRTGIRDEGFIFPEIDFLQSVIDLIEDAAEAFAKLDPLMKIRFIVFRLLGLGFIIGGIAGCYYYSNSTFMIALFTLVIIGGATLWIAANPNSYNSRVESARMVPCSGKMTNEELYEFLRMTPASLGSPRFAAVRGFKKPVIVYGSKTDDYIYAVYHAPVSSFFYVSRLSSWSLKETLTTESTQNNAADYKPETGCYDNDLSEITAVVEAAVERASKK